MTDKSYSPMNVITLTKVRNGVCGTPYKAGIVEQNGKKYLIIQFRELEETAAFELEDLKNEDLDNHLRGDYFADEFARTFAMEGEDEP